MAGNVSHILQVDTYLARSYCCRYSFDNVGVALFGQAFGFLKNSIDYHDYIHSTHLAMPFLTLLTVTPYYIRPVLLLVTVCIPKLLKAVLAIEDIKKAAIAETKTAMKRSLEVTGKRPDLTSQLLAIVQEKGEKVNYSHKEITSDMWVGVYVLSATFLTTY
jgi:hypothetical protein